MKKIVIIIIICIGLLLCLTKNNDIINKKYYIDNNNYFISVDYPYFNNKNIDEDIVNYVDTTINEFKYKASNYSYMYLDYDYKGNDKIIFYKYFNINNKVDIDSVIFNINDNVFNIEKVSNNINENVLGSDFIYVNKKMIALTFDDGPNYNTSKILEILNKYNVKATFFVIGSKINHNEKIIETMDKYGMEIGNHTYSHKLMTKMDSDSIIKEINDTNNLVYEVIGKYPKLVRPSYGSFNKKIKESINMPIIIWNIDTLDWKSHNSEKIVSRVMNKVSDGDIILMHDIYSATVKAVDILVPKLIEEGYQLVSVSELFYYKNINLENGKIYGKAG